MSAQHRENNLAQKFQGVPDIDLLDELKRRKRLRVLSVTRMFYKELHTAEGYLDGIDADLARLLGKKIIDDKAAKIDERDGSVPNNNSPMVIRDATVMLVLPTIETPDEKDHSKTA